MHHGKWLALVVAGCAVWSDVQAEDQELKKKAIAIQTEQLQACASKQGEEFVRCVRNVSQALERMVEPQNEPGRFERLWGLPIAKDGGIPVLSDDEKAKAQAVAMLQPAKSDATSGNLEDTSHCRGSICAYRPNYAIFRYSNNPNSLPHSPTPGRNVTTPLAHQSTELKYQLSLKSWWYDLGPVQVWSAFTQQSSWQIFNDDVSRPFRDTNYEIEPVYLNLPWRAEWAGYEQLHLRMLGVGFTHQSNGQSNPLSRSWNRFYLQGGFALTDNLSLLAKLWARVPEKSTDDDNPDISNYMGRGELNFTWTPELLCAKSVVGLRLRHSLNPAASHGSALLEYSCPFPFSKLPAEKRQLRLYFQAFRGYGESMLDYNHQQTTFGLGIGVLNWGL